jgi:S1-C subfamily serine protease
MHKFFKLLSILVISMIVTGCAGLDRVRDPSSLVTHMGNSTVALVIVDARGVRPYCTGVWLDDNQIVTAHHCVQSVANHIAGVAEDVLDVDVLGVKIHYLTSSEVTEVGEEPSAVHLAKVIVDDSIHDVALIKVVGGAVPEHDYAQLATEMPAIGERIHIVGHVRGFYWSYVEGTVASYRGSLPMDDKGGPFLQLSAPVYYGNSGGGVFDEDGDLVGIVSFMSSAPLTNFAIPVKRVRELVKESHQIELKKIKK